MADSESPGGNSPAGWYPDAENPGVEYYWDHAEALEALGLSE